MSNGHYNVLFLSNRNTARSIFAEAVMKRIGREHFTGFSAGMRLADQLDPLARDVLRTKQYPTDGLYPKHWSQFAKPNALPLDFVFALRSNCGRAVAALAGSSGHRGLALS
jgi:arsenate reductase (thioredoxin)